MAITLRSRKELDGSMTMEKQIEAENEMGKADAENNQDEIKGDDRRKSQT